MLSADFFSHLGLVVKRGFLDREACARIRAEVQGGVAAPRKIVRDGVEIIDENFRKRSTVTVSAATRLYVEERLLALRSDLEGCFGLEFPEHEAPYFGAYRPGDFFLPHTDRADHPDAPEPVGEAGTLIAFRANVSHEVESITNGVRYTVVCRFGRSPRRTMGG